ncbi:methionine adenosyltransferase [Candidatus Peregrinibacteria bacterium]|jgi:S-adenosylmethionine synthetase|nr:methionine adenosyltransferase [Candidatus Peregrinibacteria bacterium]MBT5468580.1 methionine adenosyltransferase [Candidatus Peregrinibacteria bacterium]MBT7337618.1 methionine adenosyltransferase [Candidatus Peregrinibacteria bacterium]
MSYLFTSESVTEGHPDKICDQISDTVLDAILQQDPDGACCCECFTTTSLVVVGGEISTSADIDLEHIARSVLKDIGYTDAAYGIDSQNCKVLNVAHEQSTEIAQGENTEDGTHKAQGAGDQGIMFGYACNETDELMPLPITLAHALARTLTDVRKSGTVSHLRPDGKSQVTVEYDENNKPQRVDTVVLAAQHDEGVTQEQIKKDLLEHVIRPVCGEYMDDNTKILINETGAFIIGGPHGDTGLTGRKIIVDTYGGMGRHGGGAFSGKVPNKQDRSGAYMARYIAKNVVAAGLASKCELQLSYAIGYPEPVSVHITTFGTGTEEDRVIEEAIKTVFDMTPAGIIKTLDLLKPIYRATSAYGHFGRREFPWEATDKVQELTATIAKRKLVTAS